MNTRELLSTATVAMTLTITTHAAQLGPAAIFAGAARLDNGSIITIGQPFVGTMHAQDGGVSFELGILPALDAALKSPPSINTSVQITSGLFTFGFQTHAGRNYIIQASTNLSTWVPIWTNVGNGNVFQFTDMEPAEYPQRFYRVMTP